MTDDDLSLEFELHVDVLATAEGAFVVDMNQRIVQWNDAARAVLGYTADDVVGRLCSEVLTSCHGDAVAACPSRCTAVRDARRGRATPSFDVPVTSRSGDVVWLHLTTLRARTASGQPCVMHLLHDVSPYHRLNDSATGTLGHRHRRGTSATERDPHSADSPQTARAPQLTRRELEVATLLASGLSNGEIAEALSISPITARNHVTSVIEKLGVRTRLQAVVVASRLGLI